MALSWGGESDWSTPIKSCSLGGSAALAGVEKRGAEIAAATTKDNEINRGANVIIILLVRECIGGNLDSPGFTKGFGTEPVGFFIAREFALDGIKGHFAAQEQGD